MTCCQDAVYLNLYNFDLPQHENSPYIVTSPRSLKACHQLGIKPCELLYKSLDEYEEELHHLPPRDVIYLYEQGERARQNKLSACRELRLRQVCRPLRRRSARRGAGIRPDLLPPVGAAMSAASRSATPPSALSRTKSVSWAGLDQSGDHFTDLHREDGALSSEEEAPADAWSSEDEESNERSDGEQKVQGIGRMASSASSSEGRNGENSAGEGSDGRADGDVGEGSEFIGEGEQDVLYDEDVYDMSDAEGSNASASEEEYEDIHLLRNSNTGTEVTQRDGEEDEQHGDILNRQSSSVGSAAAGGYGQPEDGEDTSEDEEEPGWYPMEDYRSDPPLELRSSAGFSAVSDRPSDGHGRPPAVSFSDRPSEGAQRPAKARASASSRSAAPTREKRRRPDAALPAAQVDSAGWTPVPSLRTVSVDDLPSLRHLAASGADLRVRPSDRRILELMTRRQEQERLQERRAHQERRRWRQEWLQHLRQQSELADQRVELVMAKRRAEAWESRRRREELAQQHTQSLENLTALINHREERARIGLAEQHHRQHQQLMVRQRREEQQRLMASEQRERLETEQLQQRQQQQQLLQRRMDQTERRKCDLETAKTQRVSSLNASWLALSEERIQRLEEAAQHRSRRVWQQLSRRLQTAADNQRSLAQCRRTLTAARSAADGERRRQARAARQQQLQLSAGRSREAAARLQQDQLRAERTVRQLTESRQLAVSRENLARQVRHQHSLRHIRQLEDQMVDEARFKMKLDEARVEQFVRQREMATVSSRQLAHVAANLRQAVRAAERSATFDKMAARADLECRVLNGPGQSCHRLYRPHSRTHVV